jgi:hypothetical protein
MVKTLHSTRKPNPDEAELSRVLRAWSRILERALDTLAATDHKDALKWCITYNMAWERLICYMMRTAPVEDWEDEPG